MPTKARRAVETSSRPARSLARPPRWDSRPKLLSTTHRRASTTKPLAAGSRATTRWRVPWRFDHSRQRPAADAPSWTPSRNVPAGLAGVQRLERVPVLHGGRPRRAREPGALGVDRRRPLAGDDALGRVPRSGPRL